MSKIETIDRQFGSAEEQKSTYLHTFKMGTHKLRVSIARDNFYLFQSHARIEKWDGTQWHQIHRIDTNEMKTKESHARVPLVLSRFAEDEKRLIDAAKKII